MSDNDSDASNFTTNFKRSRQFSSNFSRSVVCSDDDNNDDDDNNESEEPEFYEDIELNYSDSNPTAKKKKKKKETRKTAKSVDLLDAADDRASDVDSDATTKKKKKETRKTAGSKRDHATANDDDDNDTDDEKEANKKNKSAYQKELLNIECENFTDLVIEEVTVLDQKILVPREYSATVSDILDCPTLVKLSNAWIKEHIIPAESLKEKKPTAIEKANAIVVFRSATEKDITHFLKQKCSKDSTNIDMSDLIKLRLMRTHFKFALFLHIGQLLQNSVQIQEYFSSNISNDMFPHKKKGTRICICIMYSMLHCVGRKRSFVQPKKHQGHFPKEI